MHARDQQENYYNSKAKERSFAVGHRCLVHFETSAKGSNQKFIKRWKGVCTVTKLVGPVNVQLQATPSSKPVLVHINGVKHLCPDDFQEYYCDRKTTFLSKLLYSTDFLFK